MKQINKPPQDDGKIKLCQQSNLPNQICLIWCRGVGDRDSGTLRNLFSMLLLQSVAPWLGLLAGQ